MTAKIISQKEACDVFFSFLSEKLIPAIEGKAMRAIDPLYLRIFLNSFGIAILATGAALVLGYPAAYFIAAAPPRRGL